MGYVNIEVTMNNTKKRKLVLKADVRNELDSAELEDFLIAAVNAYNDQINGY